MKPNAIEFYLIFAVTTSAGLKTKKRPSSDAAPADLR